MKVGKSGKIYIFLHVEKNYSEVATFIGDYMCRLDAKARVIFPSAFKKQMPPASGDRFVIKRDIFEKCLILYPMEEWERQNKIIRSKINPYNKEHSRFLREFFKGTAEIVLDASNRLLLPKRLLEYAGIDKEIVMAGQGGKIEIWSKDLYNSVGESGEEFALLAEKIMGGNVNEIDE